MLEFQRPDHAGWRALFSDRPATFVVSAAVIREVDKAKTATRLRLRKRARSLLPWLRDRLRDSKPLPNGASLEFYRPTPVRVLERGDLHSAFPDDVILASAIAYSEEHPDRDVLFVTEDTGASIRADGFGLASVSPPSELRLPPEPSEEEQELAELREKVRQLTTATPTVWLRAGDKQPIRASVNQFHESVESRVSRAMEQQRAEWPDRTHYGSEFARKVAAYLTAIEAHERRIFPLLKWAHHAFLVHLEIGNDGGLPATDVDLILEAPKGISFTDTLPKMPKRPTQPTRPDPFAASTFPGAADLLSPALADFQMPGLGHHFQNVGNWLIDPDNRARLHLKTIKHGLKIALPRLLASFTDGVSNFGIEWSAHVGNSPVPFEGRLNFVADEQRTSVEFKRFLSSATEDE